MYKIIIDTNLWISYLLGKKLIKLKDLFLNEKVSVITCQELIEEFVDVSSRNYITKYVEKKNILETLDLMKEFSVQVQLGSYLSCLNQNYQNNEKCPSIKPLPSVC